jgi:hypothetical protein
LIIFRWFGTHKKGKNVINFVLLLHEDLPLLKSWIAADTWHTNTESPEWWFGGYISFKLVDDRGIVLFVRFDREGDFVRLHTQFAPPSEVSEKRVALAISDAIPRFSECAKIDGVKGIVTESVSPKLVAFLQTRFGFKLDKGNDYVLVFDREENHDGQRTDPVNTERDA